MARWFRQSIWIAVAVATSILPLYGQPAQDEAALEAEWRKILREGIEAYQRGDTEEALAKWEAANRVYDRRPEGYNNIAVVFADRGDHARAAAMYRQALAVFTRMRSPLDSEREAWLSTRRDIHQGLLTAGEELFREGKAAEAADAFAALTAANPRNRTAWYDLALALYGLMRWAELAEAAGHVVELDPLNDDARRLLLDAQRRQNIAPDAKLDPASLPIHLDELRLVSGADRVTLRGTTTGAAAPAGAELRLEVTLYDCTDPVGTHAVTITAPTKGQQAPFTAAIATSSIVTDFSYRLSQ